MVDDEWEPLAELKLYFRNEKESLYCLCSRAVLRSEVSDCWDEFLEIDKQDTPECSESIPVKQFHDVEPVLISTVKKNEVEATSCYCSASHYSTDDYESVMQSASEPSHTYKDASNCTLQNSDSGADLSEHCADRMYSCIVEEPSETTRSQLTIEWERYWSSHGEAIIWKSWIERYGLYINPTYVETVNTEDKKHDARDIPDVRVTCSEDGDDDRRARTDSFGSGSGYERLRYGLRSRCSNASFSGKSVANTTITTDSMTNVTKITVSSLDLSCESESSETSLSSTSSEPNSGSNSESSQGDTCPENDAWWRHLWKEHYDELFTESFNKFQEEYLAERASKAMTPSGSDEERQLEDAKAKLIQKFCSDGASNYGMQENKDNELLRRLGDEPIDDSTSQTRVKLYNRFGVSSQQKNNFQSRSYLNSVGYILERLHETSLSDKPDGVEAVACVTNELTDIEELALPTIPLDILEESPCLDVTAIESNHSQDVVEAGDTKRHQSEKAASTSKSKKSYSPTEKSPAIASGSKRSLPNDNDDDDDDDQFSPKRQVTNLRSHEADNKKKDNKTLEPVKGIMNLMNLHFDPLLDGEMTHGHVTYRKRNIRAQNRRLKLVEARQRVHLFFDDEGNVASKETVPVLDAPVPKPEVNEGYEAHSSSVDEDDEIGDTLESVGRRQKKKKKKQKKGNGSSNLPPVIVENKQLIKYYFNRHQLFFKYELGIRLDAESWYSVTPEKIASHQAERCRCDVIVDAFCGAGGNAIQFAFTCERVIAIDIDPEKISLARHNAEIYGVADRIEFVIGDFVKLAPNLQADVVFLSPPWGGPLYKHQEVFSMEALLPPLGGRGLLDLAHNISYDVAFFLPRNVNTFEVLMLGEPGGAVEIEENFLESKFVGVTAYLGDLVVDPHNPVGLELE